MKHVSFVDEDSACEFCKCTFISWRWDSFELPFYFLLMPCLCAVRWFFAGLVQDWNDKHPDQCVAVNATWHSKREWIYCLKSLKGFLVSYRVLYAVSMHHSLEAICWGWNYLLRKPTWLISFSGWIIDTVKENVGRWRLICLMLVDLVPRWLVTSFAKDRIIAASWLHFWSWDLDPCGCEPFTHISAAYVEITLRVFAVRGWYETDRCMVLKDEIRKKKPLFCFQTLKLHPPCFPIVFFPYFFSFLLPCSCPLVFSLFFPLSLAFLWCLFLQTHISHLSFEVNGVRGQSQDLVAKMREASDSIVLSSEQISTLQRSGTLHWCWGCVLDILKQDL